MESIIVDHWRPVFRHAAGTLGSAFLTAAREQRLIGWKSGSAGRVAIPPRDTGGAGEWVELGRDATLLGAVPAEWLADGDVPAGYTLARVLPDGADTPCPALMQADPNDPAPAPGMRLEVRFSTDTPDAPWLFWFVRKEGRA